MALNPDQFSVEYPYPRLRESYARHWAIELATSPSEDAGEAPIHPIEALHNGRWSADQVVKMHLMDPNKPAAKKLLIEKGFKTRHDMRKQYSSWFN
jgi:hypothetical protein